MGNEGTKKSLFCTSCIFSSLAHPVKLDWSTSCIFSSLAHPVKLDNKKLGRLYSYPVSTQLILCKLKSL
uniref:Putative ovule protein n=1 Tax=Solanum chacoense TaxID=4108 RepID=A0A0V0GMY2_SOLCH